MQQKSSTLIELPKLLKLKLKGEVDHATVPRLTTQNLRINLILALVKERKGKTKGNKFKNLEYDKVQLKFDGNYWY